ncbi:hypothetical protein ABVN80_15255 [Acinetobacter baumannii]
MNLPKWELNQDFLRLLVSYVRLLPLKKQSNLASKEIATLIFEVSGRNHRVLNRLVVECAKEAILQGDEEITYMTSLRISLNGKNQTEGF